MHLCAGELDLPAGPDLAAARRDGDAEQAAHVETRERTVAVRDQLIESSLEDDFAASLARARTEIDDVVGRANHLRIVLDDQDRVAQIAQVLEDAD